MTCGVYEVWCGPYFYQGSSKNIEHRWEVHLRDLRKGKHKNPKFQAAYNKHGWTDQAVLVECDENCVRAWEQEYIDSNWGDAKYLNLNPQAWGGREPGFKQPPHVGDAIARSNKLRVWTEESKHKLRETVASRTPEERAAYSAKLRARPRPGPPSPAEVERIRALGQRERTPEELDRLRNLRTDQPVSDETRAKLSAAKKGKPHSDEHRARLAEAARKRWAKARGEV